MSGVSAGLDAHEVSVTGATRQCSTHDTYVVVASGH